MRVPRPLGSCHQCCTSPSTNWRPAARSRCSRVRSGRAMQQRHHVLELVAEAEGAARLVVAGARPQPAAQVLVEQPAVHHQVEGVVGRAHLHRVEDVGPRPATHRVAAPPRRPPGWPCRATQLARRRCVLALAEQEHEPPRLARGERERHLQRRAGIEPGAEAAGERLVRESAAGRGQEPLRPRNDVRSPVAERSGSLAWAKATRPANSRL